MRYRFRLMALAAVAVLAFFPTLAMAQGVVLTDPSQPDWGLDGIVELVAAVIAAAGFFYARFKQTRKTLPMSQRLARTIDVSQIVDSTRKLDDPDPNDENSH